MPTFIEYSNSGVYVLSPEAIESGGFSLDINFKALVNKDVALQAAIDGKANTFHTHAISDVTNLQPTLNTKITEEDYNDFLSAGIVTPTVTANNVKINETGQLKFLDESGATLQYISGNSSGINFGAYAGVHTDGSFYGSGASITGVNAATLGGIAAAGYAAATHTHSGSDITSGTVDNARTTATSANTVSAIVARDGSGNFSAGTITATAFSGAGASVTGVNAATLGGIASAGYAAATHTHAASDIASGTVATARLGSGTAGATNYLRGDQTWSSVDAATLGGVGSSGYAPSAATTSALATLTAAVAALNNIQSANLGGF